MSSRPMISQRAALLGALLATGVPAADPLIVVRAMKASTIVEVFIEQDVIRVEFEIGVKDLKAFHDLLPDALRAQLGLGPSPIAMRLERFLAEGFTVRTAGGICSGRIAEIESRRRVRRDQITGQPLPASEGEGEPIVFAALEFRLDGRPGTIWLKPPTNAESGNVTANLGFVTYHRGVAVNDFRYLAKEEPLDLDWEDPWFSRFRNRNLKRRFDSPLSVFLYADHFEVRKEVIVRPKDLQQWVDLGLDGKQVIPVADQEELKRRVAAFLAPRAPVTIDGRAVEPRLDRIHFIRQSLRQTGVVDPPEDMDLVSATLGVIFAYPIDALPNHVEMTWDLFGERFGRIPSVATDEAGGLPSILTPDDPVLVWQNFLTNPTVPAMRALAAPPGPPRIGVPVLSVLLAGFLPLFLVASRRRRQAEGVAPRSQRATLTWVVSVTVVAGLCWPLTQVRVQVPFAPRPALAQPDATAVLGGLLHNVYRAFDRRDESLSYDILAQSVAGDLLADVYLEARRGLELENQGGARCKVTDVEMLAVEHDMLAADYGFEARSSWVVSGSVGHWGHIHQRRNRYDARVTVRVIDGHWRITELELLEERRL